MYMYFAGYSATHSIIAEDDTYVLQHLSPGSKIKLCMMAEGRTGLSEPTGRSVFTLEQGTPNFAVIYPEY